MTHRQVHKDSLQLMGYNGEGCIKYEIQGFDREHLVVSVKRERPWSEDNYKWKVNLEIPRYGRNREQVKSEAECASNIKAALSEAITEMQIIEQNTELLDKHFKIGEADRQAKAAEEERIRKEKYNADEPVGMKLAKTIVAEMQRFCKSQGHGDANIMMFSRGERKEQNVRCQYSYSGLTLYNIGWSRISRKEVTQMLADSHMGSLKIDGLPSMVDPRVAKFLMKA